MRDIYLIAKFSNMDIIILFLFINLSISPSPPSVPRSTLPLPNLRFIVQNIPFMLHINRPLYRAEKKNYRLYHTRAHAHTYTHIQTHIFSRFLTDLLINR